MIFSFGQTERERIEVAVLDYERVPVGEYHDDNWLKVQIRIWAGGFRGEVGASIVTDELVAFLAQLRPLYDNLSGTAEFVTLEGHLHLSLTSNSRGHIDLVGEVVDQPNTRNRLHFTLAFDQSHLRTSTHELESVISAFPVR